MKRAIVIFSVFAIVSVGGYLALAAPAPTAPTAPASPATIAADTYSIDAAHTSVLFSIRHMGVARFYGRFNGIDGDYAYDPSDFSTLTVAAKIPTNTIDTNHNGRDRHLKNADFFNAGEFPYLTFETKGAKSLGSDKVELTGTLEMLGVKKPVTFQVEKIGEGKGPRGDDRSGFEARATIRRSDFGMNQMVGPVGDQVTLTISFEALSK